MTAAIVHNAPGTKLGVCGNMQELAHARLSTPVLGCAQHSVEMNNDNTHVQLVPLLPR